MTTPSAERLPRRWFASGGHQALWGDQGTYQGVAGEMLPPLSDDADVLLARLALAPTVSDPLGIGGGDNWHKGKPLAERLAPLVEQATALGLSLPPGFVRFVTSPELIGRVPSCTACYVDLPNRLVELPGQPGRLLRFLNDQQATVLWYLHLTPGGGHAVVCAQPQFLDDSDATWLDDACTLQAPAQCAASFAEFLHRFWLENALWFALSAGTPLTAEHQAYVDAARAAGT